MLKRLILGVAVSLLVSVNTSFAAEYKGADLPATIHTLAKNAGLSAIINEEVKGKIYMTVPDVPMPELMGKLAEAYDFNWKIEDGYLIVSPAKINSHTKAFSVKYANLEHVKTMLLSFMPEGSVTLNPHYSTITVDGMPWQISKAQKLIDKLDVPVQQVLIQAQMVELSKSDSEKLGFGHAWENYTNTTGNIRNLAYATTLNAESIIQKGKILARPTVVTINGRQAELLMGEKVPIIKSDSNSDGSRSTSVEFEKVGVNLTATPRINGEDSDLITTELNPEISSITAWVEYEGSKAPQIATRSAKTEVRVKSGETIIIGGLIKDEEVKALSGIPILKDLPILGALFKSKNNTRTQTEVFIFITPYILDENGGIRKKHEDAQPDLNAIEEVPGILAESSNTILGSEQPPVLNQEEA